MRATDTISWRGWERQVADWLELGDWAFIHITDSRRSHSEGWPDYVAFKPGESLAIECKTGRGVVRKRQLFWKHVLELAGFRWYAWWPEHGAEAQAVLLAGMTLQDLALRSTLLEQARRTRRLQKRNARADQALASYMTQGGQFPVRPARAYHPAAQL